MSQGEYFGELFQRARLERDWSAATAAALYGYYSRGRAVSEGAIYKLEEGYVPQDPRRRWVLARMYNIAPAVLGLSLVPQASKMPTTPRKTRKVNVEEFERTLISYWKDGYQGSAETALLDLGTRINALHDNIPYARSEQGPMLQLLCGYHMRRAEVARELGYEKGALDHYNKAVQVATENDYTDLLAAAYYRRGEFYFDRWELTKALRDFEASLSLNPNPRYLTPPQVTGRILNVKGLALARSAQSDAEMSKALRVMDSSGPFVRADVEDDFCMVDFSQSIYTKNRIKALIGPSMTRLRRPGEAESLLDTDNVLRETVAKRFRTYDRIENTLNYASIYLDKGYYPVATTLFQDVLLPIDNGYRLYVPVVQRAYERLLESSFGKSEAVAELGLRLLVVQAPQLFR